MGCTKINTLPPENSWFIFRTKVFPNYLFSFLMIRASWGLLVHALSHEPQLKSTKRNPPCCWASNSCLTILTNATWNLSPWSRAPTGQWCSRNLYLIPTTVSAKVRKVQHLEVVCPHHERHAYFVAIPRTQKWHDGANSTKANAVTHCCQS